MSIAGSHYEDAHRRGKRRLLANAVVDLLQPAVVPLEPPGARVGDSRVAAEADLSVTRGALLTVNPRPHDQVHRPLDGARQCRELGRPRSPLGTSAECPQIAARSF